MRVFISSTFKDFIEERDFMQLHVFPIISKIFEEEKVEFIPLDLRWGIEDRAKEDHKIVELCLKEVKRTISYEHSVILIMLTNRYGWEPLPNKINIDIFNKYLLNCTIDEVKLLQKWYYQDRLNGEVSYSLRRIGNNFGIQDWTDDEPHLVQILKSNCNNLVNIKSITEQEITSWLEESQDSDRILYINNLKNEEKRDERITNLDKALRSIVKTPNILDLDYWDKINKKEIYFDKIKDFLVINFNKILKVINLTHFKINYYELEKNAQLAYLQSKCFKPSNDNCKIKEKIVNYLNGNENCLLLYGKPSTGKSNLIKYWIENNLFTNYLLVYVNIGLTSYSFNNHFLINYLLYEIGVDINDYLPISERNITLGIEKIRDLSYERRAQYLWDRIDKQKRNVLIILDGVEKLYYEYDTFHYTKEKLTSKVIFISSHSEENSLSNDNYEKLFSKCNEKINLNFTNYLENNLQFLKSKIRNEYYEKSNNVFATGKIDSFGEVVIYEFILKNFNSNTVSLKAQQSMQKPIVYYLKQILSNKFYNNSQIIERILAYITISKNGLSFMQLVEVFSDEIFRNDKNILMYAHFEIVNNKIPLYFIIKFLEDARIIFIEKIIGGIIFYDLKYKYLFNKYYTPNLPTYQHRLNYTVCSILRNKSAYFADQYLDLFIESNVSFYKKYGVFLRRSLLYIKYINDPFFIRHFSRYFEYFMSKILDKHGFYFSDFIIYLKLRIMIFNYIKQNNIHNSIYFVDASIPLINYYHIRLNYASSIKLSLHLSKLINVGIDNLSYRIKVNNLLIKSYKIVNQNEMRNLIFENIRIIKFDFLTLEGNNTEDIISWLQHLSSSSKNNKEKIFLALDAENIAFRYAFEKNISKNPYTVKYYYKIRNLSNHIFDDILLFSLIFYKLHYYFRFKKNYYINKIKN